MRHVDFNAVPRMLQELPAWVAWRWRKSQDGERWTKVPFRITTRSSGRPGHRFLQASSTDPATWTDFEWIQGDIVWHEECAYRLSMPLWMGAGFVLRNDFGISVIDLDDCRNRTTGEFTTAAAAIIAALDSYTEVSPSGTGVKIYAAGLKPGPRCKNVRRGVEIYSHARFVAITGNHLPGTPAQMQPRAEAIARLYAELFPDDGAHAAAARGRMATVAGHAAGGTSLADADLIDRAMHARGGDRFTALWNGDTSAYAGDESSADFALALRLAFWCGPDPTRIESFMYASGLVRQKWRARPRYLADTIARAIARTPSHFGDGTYDAIDSDPEFAHLRSTPIHFSTPGRRGPRLSASGHVSDRAAAPAPRPPHVPAAANFDDLDVGPERSGSNECRHEAKFAAELRQLSIDIRRMERSQYHCPTPYHILQGSDYGDVAREGRCGSWRCSGCGKCFRERWKMNLRYRLTLADDAPESVFAAWIPRHAWNAIRQRIARSRRKHGGDAVRFIRFDADTFTAKPLLLVTTVDVFDGIDGVREFDGAGALERLTKQLDLYAGKSRPISTSQEWSLPHDNEAQPEKYTTIGKLDRYWSANADKLIRYIETCGAQIVFKSSPLTMPLRIQGKYEIAYPEWFTHNQRHYVREGLMRCYWPDGTDACYVTGPPPAEPPDLTWDAAPAWSIDDTTRDIVLHDGHAAAEADDPAAGTVSQLRLNTDHPY